MKMLIGESFGSFSFCGHFWARPSFKKNSDQIEKKKLSSREPAHVTHSKDIRYALESKLVRSLSLSLDHVLFCSRRSNAREKK